MFGLRTACAACSIVIFFPIMGLTVEDGSYIGFTSQDREITITVSEGVITMYGGEWACGPYSGVYSYREQTCPISDDGRFSCGTSQCPPVVHEGEASITGTFFGYTVSGFVEVVFQVCAPPCACCYEEDYFTAYNTTFVPLISIKDVDVTEGDVGTTLAEFDVNLTIPSAEVVSVEWNTRDRIATWSDYEPSSGTVVFQPGQTEQKIGVVVFGDTDGETDEYFYVDLSNPVNAAIIDGRATCIIKDDDRPITLHDQTDLEGTTGVATQDFEVANEAYDSEAADDFVVPDGGWEIISVKLRGLYVDGDGPAEGFNLWFYRDSSGWPSSNAACSYSEVVPTADLAGEDTVGTISLNLPTPCTLSPGRHWLAAQARMDYTDGGQFLWSQRVSQVGLESVWRNPGDGFGWGWTSWTRLTTAFPNSSDPDLIFLLKGWPNVPPIFVDGFESGDSTEWSSVVGDLPQGGWRLTRKLHGR